MKLLDVETDPKMRSTSRIVASWLLRLRLAPMGSAVQSSRSTQW